MYFSPTISCSVSSFITSVTGYSCCHESRLFSPIKHASSSVPLYLLPQISTFFVNQVQVSITLARTRVSVSLAAILAYGLCLSNCCGLGTVLLHSWRPLFNSSLMKLPFHQSFSSLSKHVRLSLRRKGLPLPSISLPLTASLFFLAVERAQYFYISGFFLTVSPDSVQVITKHASENNKVNLLTLASKTLFLMLHVYADSQADWHLIKLAAPM